jgi:hypothetical protein
LQTLTLEPSTGSPGYISEVAIPPTSARDPQGVIAEQSCSIWFKPMGEFDLSSLIERVRKELEILGHNSQRNLILMLLCLNCLHQDQKESPVASLNEILNHVVDADLSQFYVLSCGPPDNFQRFKFGSFEVGKINLQRLEYRCKKADSDYFTLWGGTHSGKFAIERNTCRVRVFDWVWFSENYGKAMLRDSEALKFWSRLTSAYFFFLSAAYFEDFWTQFLEEQELQNALGAPFMREREIRLLPSTASISIYLNIGNRWGYVAPHGTSHLVLELAGMDKRIPLLLRTLKDDYCFEQFDSSELHQTIKTFARFISKAKRHMIEDRPAEGYLHFMIALDLLFGDKEELTRNIARRVAVITHRKLKVPFQDVVRSVARAYESRSKYVHEGDSSAMSDLDAVQQKTEEVLYCMLRLQKNTETHKPHFVESWRKSLDFFATAIESGRSIPDVEMVANGIWVG